MHKQVVLANASTEFGFVTKIFFFANLLVAIDIETVMANSSPSGIIAMIIDTYICKPS